MQVFVKNRTKAILTLSYNVIILYKNPFVKLIFDKIDELCQIIPKIG